jgi:putative endonuclease
LFLLKGRKFIFLLLFYIGPVVQWTPACRQGISDNMDAYVVYILKSGKDGRLYKGLTRDLEKRIKEHNNGKTKTTKGFRPWELIYKEEFITLKESREREKYFKTGVGRDYLKRLAP